MWPAGELSTRHLSERPTSYVLNHAVAVPPRNFLGHYDLTGPGQKDDSHSGGGCDAASTLDGTWLIHSAHDDGAPNVRGCDRQPQCLPAEDSTLHITSPHSVPAC